jgi:hypothetical protein
MNARWVVLLIVVAGAAFALGRATVRSDGQEGPVSGALLRMDDPAARFGEILAMGDARERTRQLVQLFDATDPALAPRLRAVLEEREAALRVDETTEALFAQWWARADPAAAYREAFNPLCSDRHPWIREVMRAWTPQDPTAAAAAVLDLPPGPSRGRLEAARAVVDAWLAMDDIPDPMPLFLVVEQLEPVARGGALQHVVETMAERRGVPATLDFVRGLPLDGGDALSSDVMNEVLSRTAIVLLEHDPALAVAWAAEHADGPAGVGIHKHLAYYWAIRDGEAAMEWAVGLPDDPRRPAVVKRAWVSFGRKHSDEARAWLHARAPDEALRNVYSGHLRGLAERDPQLALALANRAVNEAIRQEMRAAAASGWMRSDPAAASAWLAEAGLPPALEQHVRNTARGRATAAARGDGA